MNCKILLLLNLYVAIFTWQNCSSYGLVDTVSIDLHRQLDSYGSNRGSLTLPYVIFGFLLFFF
jgi:hypothetical protein